MSLIRYMNLSYIETDRKPCTRLMSRNTGYMSIKYLLEPNSDTEAKAIATKIAKLMFTLDTQAKAAFDREVINAFRVKNPKPKGRQLHQKKYMTLRQGLKQKQYLSLSQSLRTRYILKAYEPKP